MTVASPASTVGKFHHRARRLFVTGLLLLAVGFLAVMNGVPAVAKVQAILHDRMINSASYKAANGHWDFLPVPKEDRVNGIHAVLLYTGKVLIVAGSGNNELNFENHTFKSLLWDPATNQFKLIPTPSDMFCGGHAFLPDGRVLIAGGTRRYEVLASDVTHAAGIMTIENDTSIGGPLWLPKGTKFTAPNGQEFISLDSASIKPARAKKDAHGKQNIVPSSKEIWVQAVNTGKDSVFKQLTTFSIDVKSAAAVHAHADNLSLDKQDFQGSDSSYIFDPATERYTRVSNMTIGRWYPTLVGLEDGRILASSGLDSFGRIVPGNTEIFDPRTNTWQDQPQLNRTFPTYNALFLTGNGNLFYSGSNAGYGSATVGRTPGIWNIKNNTFQVVPGLRDPKLTETSGSVLLPPAQRQQFMIVGGGGVGESHQSSKRIDTVDIKVPHPAWRAGPDLAVGTRYPGLVITPDDKVIITGGSRDYRGKDDSDVHLAFSYDPKSRELTQLADPQVGRDYHSEALLLPDGRILTIGGDPLYNKDGTGPGSFEQRLEVFSPPYLFHGSRPIVTDGPSEALRGGVAHFKVPHPYDIASARLIRPSAVTHVTDVEQRSIALAIHIKEGFLNLTIPEPKGIVPAGWYMLFLTNRQGVPSVARWIHIT